MKINQLARKIRMIWLLQTGVPATADQLAQDLQISRRTVFRDIRELEDAGIDIRYDKPRQSYLINPHFIVQPPRLTVDELSIFVAAAHLSPLYANKHYWGKIHRVAGKLLEKLPQADRDEVLRVIDALEANWQQDRQHAQSDHVLHRLMEAIRRRHKVRLTYREHDSSLPLRTLVTPEKLSFSPTGWTFKGRSSWHKASYQFEVRLILQADLDSSPRHLETDVSPPPGGRTAGVKGPTKRKQSGSPATP